MTGTDDRDWYTLRQAARRVRRSLRTVRRWKARGMPTRLVDRTNYVEHDTLLAWYRDRLLANPREGRDRYGRWAPASDDTATP